MNNERFQLLKVIGAFAILIPAVVGVIEIFGFLTTASSKLSATLETSNYRIHPNLETYVQKAFQQESKVGGKTSLFEGAKGTRLFPGEDDFDDIVFNLQFEERHGATLGLQRFSTYKVINSGDKPALDARLVNVAGSVAVIKGQKDFVELDGKAAIDLGSIDPRSTKVIYVWSRPYMDFQSEASFVQYDGGTVDVERLIVVGGFYKYLHDYGTRFWPIVLAFLLVVFFAVVSRVFRYSKSQDSDLPVSKVKRRRPRKRKPNQNTSPPKDRD
ncbi:hypothetical protein [Pseudomonas sp. URMO17WK12:I4]|uniref:hypothetical protein n=1 Tax=Pseudomonas sp. URMO17WK12:I4 TaxID=1283292 RepID=UPI0012DF2A93|nr:hypothetical protein [Pseudomonas sp. URMO17WK12:I4]